ncbi:biotin--[acetyl-CoA-carboxylase] ligase [Pedobacter arcticus]|uniref:biotin--[acetyl-CoA-carboxylase] ligase n=1 Tax=Pedobacter arcticus TaxID=752140 RepID=UPI00036B50E4|nr:biotin--[acetyl-CoA-carboxylase] ligase [Pedobacter arcticus]
MQNNTFLTLFVGQSLVKLSEIDSTNDYLKKGLSNTKPLPEGTVIMADHQFAGRGQQSNVWKSEKGKNLTISILFKPSFLSLGQQFYLNKAISLGINDCLRAIIGDDCKIKWPNDIYHKSHKLGGVLIENTSAGQYLKTSVVGIGLNVNQQHFGEGVERATSLSKILHEDYELNDLLAQLCKSIENRYLQLKAGLYFCLDEDYLGRVYRLNEVFRYQIGDEKVSGIIKGVSEKGYLMLQIDDEVKQLDLKQVTFIFDSE